MGRGADAVVDPELRVHGVTGLRVADALDDAHRASTARSMRPASMIGEKAAEF